MTCACCGEPLRVKPTPDQAGDLLCDACADLLKIPAEETDE